MIPFSQDSYSSAYFSVLEDGTVYAADADGSSTVMLEILTGRNY
ncbi:MAG: hypothetical protein ACLS5C_06980 [Waltera sp.]